MLNETQRLLFEKVLDYNHEVRNEKNSGTQRIEALDKLNQAQIDLKNSMGENAYNNFMEMGQKLFAPKRNTTSDGDEFLDDEDLSLIHI